MPSSRCTILLRLLGAISLRHREFQRSQAGRWPCGLENLYPPKGADLSLALSNNKLLTRDNLSKRRQVEDRTCLFCNELESIHHLLFECCMAKLVWCMWSEICGVTMGADFESVAKWWVGQKKYSILNVCSASILWSLWKL